MGNMVLGKCGLPQNQVQDPNASRASNQRTRAGEEKLTWADRLRDQAAEPP